MGMRIPRAAERWRLGTYRETRSKMFRLKTSFNTDISVERIKVTTYRTFNSANAFNANISDWNVSKVTTLYRTFSSANAFNADISRWNVELVENVKNPFTKRQSSMRTSRADVEFKT